MKITLIIFCLIVLSSVASFGEQPDQPAANGDNAPSTGPAGKQRITLEMIDGPNRLLANLVEAPKWFRGENWLVIEDGNVKGMVDAETGDPVVEKPNIAFTAEDLSKAIEARDAEKNSKQDSEPEQSPVSPRLLELMADLGEATEGASLYNFNHDESKLAFASKRGLHVFDMKAKSTQTLPAESPNHLVGMLDWVYQEELYGRGNFKGYWWQPDGDQIAFLELDESPLKPFVVMDHLPIHGKSESTNYPKAGDANPLVRVGVISAADPQAVHWVDLSAYKDQEIVVSAVTWSQDGSQLMLQIQDREQTWLDLLATCLLYTSPSPRDATLSRMPSSA